LQIDFDGLARFAQGADLLVHDAQYLDADMPDKLGWGHSTVAQVLELGRRAGVKKLVLYHHDPDRHDDALDAVARETRRWWTAEVKSGEVLVAWEGLMVNL
jgi:ribonuclease BN (tRNA processing enzyme)